jgi:glutamate 5-kinase
MRLAGVFSCIPYRTAGVAVRVVVKIGSSSLTSQDGRLDVQKLFEYADIISTLHSKGVEIIVVTSGAVAAGLGQLSLSKRPQEIELLQAAASVGQAVLVWQYERAFRGHGIAIGQVLLTRAVFGDASVQSAENMAANNVVRTVTELLRNKCVPLINENDAIATDELTFGDNDQLAALCAREFGADMLYLFTDVDALYTAPPTDAHAVRIATLKGVGEIDQALASIEIGAVPAQSIGSGGMQSKLQAAKIAVQAGVKVNVAAAENMQAVLLNAGADEEKGGTLFLP